MKIAFRCDASIQIGSGHFMRCLTLADALKKQGALIRFVSRDLPEHLRDMLAAKGMEFAALKNEAAETPAGDLAHSHWLGTSQMQDVQDTAQALADQTWDWLVVDHYALDVRWESAMRTHARHIMVIDDIADRQHDCEVLLDQNFYADMQTTLYRQGSRTLPIIIGATLCLAAERIPATARTDQAAQRTG